MRQQTPETTITLHWVHEANRAVESMPQPAVVREAAGVRQKTCLRRRRCVLWRLRVVMEAEEEEALVEEEFAEDQ